MKVGDNGVKKVIVSILFYNALFQFIKQLGETNTRRFKGDPLRQLPYDIEIIAENLYVPWAVAISNEGRIYFTERSGSVRVIENGMLLTQPLITFGPPFISTGEGGLMGIELDPDFLQNHYIYVMHTYREGNQIYNRVVRLIEQGNKASLDRVLIDKIPGAQIHNGGRIKVGPDGKLYIATGDAADPQLAQDPLSTAGKILRIERDGSIPDDNPFLNSPVYSLGHRNPQGLTWSPEGVFYASEHGARAYDEVNIIMPGANYGWPLVQGDEETDAVEVQKPLVHSGQETWAPAGIAYIDKGPWRGRLLLANLRGEQLVTFDLDETGDEVQQIERWLQGRYGRLREVILAEDGSIYLTTSNQDGRGRPDRTDDKIIRLIPRSSS